MGECCSPPDRTPKPAHKMRCPNSGQECAEVSLGTVRHHVKEAWNWKPTGFRYFFCDDPACDIVYFGDDGAAIIQRELRTTVGLKVDSDDGLLCYCFGVTKGDFRRNPATRSFVISQTKAGQCSCGTSNPAGRCCLKDFPKLARE